MWNYISVCWTFTIKQSNFSQSKLLVLTITLAAAGQAPGSLSCITCAAQICFFGHGTRLLPDTQRPASERAHFAKKDLAPQLPPATWVSHSESAVSLLWTAERSLLCVLGSPVPCIDSHGQWVQIAMQFTNPGGEKKNRIKNRMFAFASAVLSCGVCCFFPFFSFLFFSFF